MPENAKISVIAIGEESYDLKDKSALHQSDKATTVQPVGTAAVTGTAATWAPADHVHNIAKSTITSVLGFTPTSYTAATAVSAISTTASVGTDNRQYARADHVHNITSATITSALGFTPLSQTDIEGLSGAMHYMGSTTVTPAITDGSATVPSDVYPTGTPANGDVIISGEQEFVWNGTKWQEFGSTGSLKALAFKDNATGSYTPSGTLTVTLPTASKNVVSSVSTASKNVVSSVSTTAVVKSVVTAAQTMVTGVTTTAQTVATGGTSTSITVDTANETLNLPAAVISAIATASINKVTDVTTASKNVVSSVSTATAVTEVVTAAQTIVTGVTTAAQTMVTGQPTVATFSGTAATITVG